MKYSINTERSVFERADDVRYFAVLGCIAADAGAFDADRIAARLDMSKSEVDNALAFWRGAGVIEADKTADGVKPKEKLKILPSAKGERGIPSYAAAELARHIDDNKETASLLHYCSKRTEKILTPAETGDIVYLVDSVGLTPSMVMSLVNYFVERGKRSIRYIAKSAISIYDEGATDDASLNEYIRKKTEYDSGESFFRSLMGAGGRALIKSEKAFVERWLVGAKTDRELIREAYERTVSKTSKASVNYMSKILERWEESGYKTVEDVNNGEAAARSEQAPSATAERRNTVLDDFDEASAALVSEADTKKTVADHDDMSAFFEN